MALSGSLGVPAQAAPPKVPTLLLFPATPGSADDLKALIALRTQLRANGRFEVLTDDPDAPPIKRAAGESHHPEWLTGAMSADTDRMALGRAVGAAFIAVVSPGTRHDQETVVLTETVPSARTWNLPEKSVRDVTRALEGQAYDSLAHPVAAPLIPIPPTVPVTVPPVPTTSVPTSSVPTVTAPPVSTTVPIPVPVPSTTPAPSTTPVPAPAPTAPTTLPAPANPPVLVPPVTSPQNSNPVQKIVPTVPAPTLPTTGDSGTQTIPLTGPVAPPSTDATDLIAIAPLMARGDDDLVSGNVVDAIARYRAAINQAPRATAPRLKLAQAYLKAGMRDKALDEAKRALEIAPDNIKVQQFLTDMDTESGSSDGALTRYTALISKNPNSVSAHLGLGDALSQSGDLTQAETEYKTAMHLAKPSNSEPAIHLARFYAAQSRYDDCQEILKSVGDDGYGVAIQIIQDRAENLISRLNSARADYDAGKVTRESFYDTAKVVSADTQGLADFTGGLTPPSAFKISHLHRTLATGLFAQEAALIVSYVETNDATQADKAAQLEKSAQTEMLTAHATEKKHGLDVQPQ